jgi:outer membrane protein assembly factor BamB
MNKHTVVCLSLLLLVTNLIAGTSVGWRHDSTGRFPDAKAPTEWSAEDNVLWKTKLENWSNASPVLFGNKIFVCVEPDTLLCLSTDGKLLWQQNGSDAQVLNKEEEAKMKGARARLQVLRDEKKALSHKLKSAKKAKKNNPDDAQAVAPIKELEAKLKLLDKENKELAPFAMPRTHAVTGYSSPTPVTDGNVVVANFGNGMVCCFDMDGNPKWARMIEKPTRGWGHSASPVMVDGKVIVHIMKVHALDIADGKTVWTAESKAHWGSPVAAKIGDVDVILTTDGDLLRVNDGTVLAKKVSPLEYNAPVIHDGIAYGIQNGGKAMKLPAVADGVAKHEVLWTTEPKKDRYYASPIYHDGLLYDITRKSEFSVIDAADGKVVYAKNLKLGGCTYPSIVMAGGNIYISSDNGKTVVIKPGREYEEVASNKLEPFRSTPVFAGSRMYVRTLKHLYCIGK